jgi:RNase P subunit RPR2
MHCWNCNNLMVYREPKPEVTEPPTVHVQQEVMCSRCGWVYEITVVNIGHRERKPQPPQEATNGQDQG